MRGRIRFLVNAACVRFTARLARTRQPSCSCPIRWAGSEGIDSLSNQCGSLLLAGASGWSWLHWPGLITPPTHTHRPAGSPREQSACPSACRPPRRLAGVWGVDKKSCQVKSRWTAAGAAAARCSLHPHGVERTSAGKLVSWSFHFGHFELVYQSVDCLWCRVSFTTPALLSLIFMLHFGQHVVMLVVFPKHAVDPTSMRTRSSLTQWPCYFWPCRSEFPHHDRRHGGLEGSHQDEAGSP